MSKSFVIIPFFLIIVVLTIDANQIEMIKPTKNAKYPLNPLKLFFMIVHKPGESPAYSIEWNFSFIENLFLKNEFVTNEDKKYYLENFFNAEQNYKNWNSADQNRFERFMEKYFDVYKSSKSFLPLQDCSALTSAIIDEMLNEKNPLIDERLRSNARAKAITSLCSSE